MTLSGPDTKAVDASAEAHILVQLRASGYGTRYVEDTGVYRITEGHGLERPSTTAGMVIIRNKRIVYAEHLRRLYPYWGRSADSPEYAEVIQQLEHDIVEGRRK